MRQSMTSGDQTFFRCFSAFRAAVNVLRCIRGSVAVLILVQVLYVRSKSPAVAHSPRSPIVSPTVSG
jgi:hypothetical protein